MTPSTGQDRARDIIARFLHAEMFDETPDQVLDLDATAYDMADRLLARLTPLGDRDPQPLALASEGLRNIAVQAWADGNRRIATMAVHWLEKLPERDNDFDAGRVTETISQVAGDRREAAELDVEQMARAIHTSGIANCRVECPDPTEFDGFSGADHDLAALLIEEYVRGTASQ